MENMFGIKELYNVALKATSQIEIGGKTFQPGENVLYFKTLQLAAVDAQTTERRATGGYDNSTLISWKTTESAMFLCEKGISSKTGMAIWSNSFLTKETASQVIYDCEEKEADEDGEIILKNTPLSTEFFIYNSSGVAPTNYTISSKTISGLTAFQDYSIQYKFTYTGKANHLNIGQRLFNGYLKLIGKMRLKDDTTGRITTGILEIPHVRLMSDLSMRLGDNVAPVVATFRLQGDPVGERGNRYVCQIIYLDSDIDSDL